MPKRESFDSQRAQGASSAYGYQAQDSTQDPRSRRRGPAGIMSSLTDRPSRNYQDGNGYAFQPQEQGYDSRGMSDPLPPPHLPFVSSGSDGGFGPGSRRDSSQSLAGSFVSKSSRDSKPSNRKSGVLSTHYVPSKMSNLHQPGQYAHRRPAKRGGGMNAWNADGHGRMGGEDEDGDEGRRATGPVKDNPGKPKKLVWNRFKWVIFIANIMVRREYTLGESSRVAQTDSPARCFQISSSPTRSPSWSLHCSFGSTSSTTLMCCV